MSTADHDAMVGRSREKIIRARPAPDGGAVGRGESDGRRRKMGAGALAAAGQHKPWGAKTLA